MRLHLHEWGDPAAPPVVCLHGVTGHGGRFRQLAEQRLAAGFHVLAPDLRGHGLSDWEPPWSIDEHLADLVETVDRAGARRAAWVGHSFGGRLAMELAAREPDRVDRMVLLDPAIWIPPPIALDVAELERKELVFSSLDEAVERRLAAGGLFHATAEAVAEALRDHLVEGEDGLLRYRYCRSAVIAAYGEMSCPPPPFERLTVPTLLVRGVQTDVLPVELVEVYRASAGGPFEIVDVRGGHIPLLDAFAETADALERFLA